MSIRIICDSLCDIPEELKNKKYLDVVPLTIIYDGKEYFDDVDITKEELYDLLLNSDKAVKTSQATYSQFKEKFQKYINQGDKIICITGASSSSGTYQSAKLAQNDLETDEIYVHDSQNLSLGAGHHVYKACELLEEGKTFDEIIYELEKLIDFVKLFFIPAKFNYLKKSGRVNLAQATVGNLLNIKMVYTMYKGKIEFCTKVRGAKKLATKLVELIYKFNKTKIDDKIIFLGKAMDTSDFDCLETEVEKDLNSRKVEFVKGGAAICCHTGPEIIAISTSK